MLSAKKEENGGQVGTANATFSTASAVGKVVNSIQGLQQQLNDYTLEEIAESEIKAKTLLVRLFELQSRLEALARIKEKINAAHNAIAQGAYDFDVSALETMGKPLRVQEIVQASKLIQFPRINRVASQISQPVTPDVSFEKEISTAVITTPEPNREIPDAGPSTSKPESVASANEPVFIFEPAGMSSIPATSAEEFTWPEESIDTLPEKESSELVDELAKRGKAPTDASESTNIETLERNVDETTQNIQSHTDDPNASRTDPLETDGADFDQRLLDDLIKNYGEIFTSADSRAPVKPKPPVEIPDSNNEKMLVEIPPAVDTKATTNRHLPLKKEGEIDRQLKKIIKDYGEYDIYSRQSPINLKFGVIGAFLLLGAVLSGFYFFSSAKPLEPSSQREVIRPISVPTGQPATPQPGGTKEAPGAVNANTLNKSPVIKQ